MGSDTSSSEGNRAIGHDDGGGDASVTKATAAASAEAIAARVRVLESWWFVLWAP